MKFLFQVLAILTISIQTLKASDVAPVSECTGDSYKIKSEIIKNFDHIWVSIDSTVGADFFLNTLMSEDKMPSNKLNAVAYYKELLTNIKSTSERFQLQGLSVSENDSKAVLKSIQKLENLYSCMQLAVK